jgi:hypothetical protein
MSDVKCPYCEVEQEINHDDGYGYGDGEEYEQSCTDCHKEFKFTTSVSFDYKVECQSGDHEMESFGDQWPNMYQCIKCDLYEHRAIDKAITNNQEG